MANKGIFECSGDKILVGLCGVLLVKRRLIIIK